MEAFVNPMCTELILEGSQCVLSFCLCREGSELLWCELDDTGNYRGKIHKHSTKTIAGRHEREEIYVDIAPKHHRLPVQVTH